MLLENQHPLDPKLRVIHCSTWTDSHVLLYHISFWSAPAGVTHAPVPYNFKLWGKRVAYDIMTSGSVTLQRLNSWPGQNKWISELACDIIWIWSYMILFKPTWSSVIKGSFLISKYKKPSAFKSGKRVGCVPSLAELLAQKLEAFDALTLCLAWHLQTKLLPKLTTNPLTNPQEKKQNG